MSYIGRGLDKISNIEHLDTITFDGSSSYSLTKNSVAFTPNSAQSLIVSIDGVVQSDNFTVSGSTIDFGVAIPSTSTCDFIKHFGTGVAFTLADGTVGTSQIADASITSAKLASGVGGKVLQVVSTHKNDDFSTASGSFIDVTGLSVSITPSSTSNKILVMFTIVTDNTNASFGTHIRLMRDSTEIAPARSDANYTSSWHRFFGDTNISQITSFQFLDSPASSSALTYKLQIKPQGGTSVVNRSGSNASSQAYSHKSSSSITVMEIAG